MTHENISTAQNMEQTGKVGRRHGEAEESETAESAGIDECSIRDRICDVSGKKVMLDVEPGEIYGDETKNVNRQVKNNAGQLAIRLCFSLREMKQKNDRGAKYPLDTVKRENDKRKWMVFDFLSGCHPFFLKIQ